MPYILQFYTLFDGKRASHPAIVAVNTVIIGLSSASLVNGDWHDTATTGQT